MYKKAWDIVVLWDMDIVVSHDGSRNPTLNTVSLLTIVVANSLGVVLRQLVSDTSLCLVRCAGGCNKLFVQSSCVLPLLLHKAQYDVAMCFWDIYIYWYTFRGRQPCSWHQRAWMNLYS